VVEFVVAARRKRPGCTSVEVRDGSDLHHRLWEVVAKALGGVKGVQDEP
jgi:hypothetical protein